LRLRDIVGSENWPADEAGVYARVRQFFRHQLNQNSREIVNAVGGVWNLRFEKRTRKMHNFRGHRIQKGSVKTWSDILEQHTALNNQHDRAKTSTTPMTEDWITKRNA
jgi:hypothetical protein